ncbi:hypothetical protein [Streptomyces pseudovenezuelae]|uniref:hypothetical protein n=1 Tax=Streptomyces pseudovenezuelae TaxID=67350 RepID=UPI0036E498AB
MATDTVPAAVPMPPEPPNGTPANTANDAPSRGFLASMVAAVDPARPATFDLPPTTASAPQTGAADGVLDRSTPGLSSASFRDAQDTATKDPSGEKRKAQGSVWKAWWLAGAQRWAKGGGTANKRLDVQKAKAQANQVKESRTTTVTNSGGLPLRNSGGAGGGSKGNDSKSGPISRTKGPVNSSGNRAGGPGRTGSGGGRGSGGGSGSNGAHGGGAGKQTNPNSKGTGSAGSGKGAPGSGGASGPGSSRKNFGAGRGSGSHDPKQPKRIVDKTGKGDSAGGLGKQGASGKSGAPGKDGKAGGTGGPVPSTGRTTPGAPGKDSGKQTPNKVKKTDKQADTRTPLEKSRETGHKDGSAIRNVVDHVKAYADGARDGYRDKRDENAKDHTRLDKAHADHKTKTTPKDDDKTTAGGRKPAIVTEKEDDGVTTDVKPLTVKNIDAKTLTLGADATRTTYGRRELRNFKQYERKLEAKETVLHKISDACVQLQKEAENEAKECQDLAEQAKAVKGGEKLGAKLAKLAEAAKNQAAEAAELARRAKRAAEMCKVVLTNIQTRYAPLYKAVVDSDETKPAELRFYNDKGSYAPAA